MDAETGVTLEVIHRAGHSSGSVLPACSTHLQTSPINPIFIFINQDKNLINIDCAMPLPYFLDSRDLG